MGAAVLPSTGLLFALAALPGLQEGRTETDPWERLRLLLYTRSVDARLHRSLMAKYGMTESAAGGFLEWYGESYTNHTAAIRLGPEEEWPSVLGGTAHLLSDPIFERTITACREVRGAPADQRGAVERILFQGELWAAFDNLYLDGIRLDQRRPPDSRRWRRLLYEVAKTMRHVALKSGDIPPPEGIERLRNAILQPVPGARPVEFYTTQRPFVHDVAGQFRRVNRFFYLDSRLEPGLASRDTLALLGSRRFPLEDGAAALIQEDCLTITVDRGLMETPVPALLKYYRVEASAGAPRLKFSMHRLDPRTPRLAPEALRSSSPEAEAWAHIDLPSVPGHKAKPALRAPLAATCAACHGRYPRAFCPGGDVLDTAQYRLVTAPQQFTAERTLDIKSLSAEYSALHFYFVSELADPENPASPVITSALAGDPELDAGMPRPPDLPAPPEAAFPLLRRISLIGLAASALLALGVAWSQRRRSRGSPSRVNP
jgi:hypothetical protein